MKTLLEKVGNPSNTLITFKEIEAHPIGKKIDITDGVISERLSDNSSGTLFFKVCMKKGAIIHSHFHNCAEEMVLYKGKILEVVNNIIIDTNKSTKFDIGENHSLYAMEPTIFYVQLYKPREK